MATNGNFTQQDQYKGTADQYSGTAATIETTTSSSSNPLSKDEVGWYFVEQYYTTLSKNPEKLHLFYGKRSQFVYGMEAEVANVSVGRQVIQERIKQLDFQDCKVRISNVDSQASFENIVIQVIGETSNKAGEPKKFVQTFVLAQQPSGYFVLNDILRYINEDNEEEPVIESGPTEEAAAAKDDAPEESETKEEAEPVKPEQTPEEAAANNLDPTVVDKKLEEVGTKPSKDASVNGDAEDAVPEVSKPEEATSKTEEPAVDPEVTARELAEEDSKEPEKPADPTPTPVAPTRAQAPEADKPVVAAAPIPAKPMTWASRIAAAAGPPRPVIPLPKTATPPAQAKAPVAAPAPAQPSASAAPAQQAEPAPKEASQGASDWQAVGGESKRQNRPQSISGPPAEHNGTMGYVKYVTEKVKTEDLRAALAAHGELTYFDINRQKNCAFVEFASPAGYQAAVAANPHIVNGENIVVEPRRPKATAYGGSNYTSGGRGNISGGRGRGGFEGNRSGSQNGPRGNFTGSQNRGRGGTPRGRGASQAANA